MCQRHKKHYGVAVHFNLPQAAKFEQRKCENFENEKAKKFDEKCANFGGAAAVRRIFKSCLYYLGVFKFLISFKKNK